MNRLICRLLKCFKNLRMGLLLIFDAYAVLAQSDFPVQMSEILNIWRYFQYLAEARGYSKCMLFC